MLDTVQRLVLESPLFGVALHHGFIDDAFTELHIVDIEERLLSRTARSWLVRHRGISWGMHIEGDRSLVARFRNDVGQETRLHRILAFCGQLRVLPGWRAVDYQRENKIVLDIGN